MQFSNRNDEYVPLASYVLVAASWRREIALGAVLAAVAGGALALLVEVLAPEYSASADVAVIDTRTTVSLDESFQAAESVFLQRRGNFNQAYLARRAALLGLVKSGNVAEAVARSMDWLEAGDPVKLSVLLDSVSAELVTIGTVTDRNQSDLLRITLEADSPEEAVLGANTWATRYVAEANHVFTPVTPGVVASVQQRLEAAEKAYLQAQVGLEKHLAQNDAEKLQRRADMMRADLAKMQEARETLLGMQIDARTTQQAMLLSERHSTRRKLEIMSGNIESLLQHVEIGGDATVPSSSLAVQLFKLQLYSMGETDLEISLENNSPVHGDEVSLLRDINALDKAIKAHLDHVNITIQNMTDGVLRQVGYTDSSQAELSEANPEFSLSYFEPLTKVVFSSRDSYLDVVDSIETDIQTLGVQLENIASRTKLLTQRRDLAYSNLETLQNEVVELQLTSAGAQSVVRIGAPAVASKSTRPSPIIAGAVLGAAMLPLSTLLVLFLNTIGIQPPLRRAGSEHQDSVVMSPQSDP